MKRIILALAILVGGLGAASAAPICGSVPYTFINGTIADATQVNANFVGLLGCINSGAANSGVNTNITQLTGLSTPLSTAQGGTGSTNGNVPFTPPGALASGTTVQAREAAQRLNLVSDYGAKCDSSTDNSTALQNFFTDVAKGRGGYIPGCAAAVAGPPVVPYKYYYGTTIVIPSGNVDVIGDGDWNSVLQYTGISNGMNFLSVATGNLTLRFRGFGLYGTMNSGTSGMNITDVPQAIFDDVGFFNWYYCLNFSSGDFAVEVYRPHMIGCGTGGNGFGIVYGNDFSANRAIIQGGTFLGGGGYQIDIPNGEGIKLDAVDIEGSYGGIELGGGGGGGVYSVDISGYIETSGAGGNIFFLGTPGASTNVHAAVLHNLWLGTSPATNWANVQGLTLKDVTIYNYSPVALSTTSGSIENIWPLGTGSFAEAAATMTRIFPPGPLASFGVATAWPGATIFVTDATVCTTGSTITGGGTSYCTGYSNGVNWTH